MECMLFLFENRVPLIALGAVDGVVHLIAIDKQFQ